MSDKLDRRISIAPMMDWTDRHCRYFHRLLSPNALLYSEMIHSNAITLGNNIDRHLGFSVEQESPVVLQLGGIDPQSLALAAKRGEEFGYKEINLNCGCPSDRVQAGAFGACLMAEPDKVATAVAAMKDAVSIPVTVKTRIGIDHQDSYEFLCEFIEKVHAGGCDVFVLHARKAWLKGLSPKENRSKPPLDWSRPHRIKQDYPQLEILTNGGFETIPDVMAQFDHVDGVMVGRKAYHEPYFLTEMETAVFNNTATPSREDVAAQMIDYMHDMQTKDVWIKHITRHMLGLYHATPNSKKWKNALMDAAKQNSVSPIENFLSQ
jgi:tRNA-dihydrouridine synthase A